MLSSRNLLLALCAVACVISPELVLALPNPAAPAAAAADVPTPGPGSIRDMTQGTTPTKLATSCTGDKTPRCRSLTVYTVCQDGLWQYETPPNVVCAGDALVFAFDLPACPATSGGSLDPDPAAHGFGSASCSPAACSPRAITCAPDNFHYDLCNAAGSLSLRLFTQGGQSCRSMMGLPS